MEGLNDESGSPKTPPGGSPRRRRPTFGIILIIAGLLLLAHQVVPELTATLFWPLLLIVAGLWLLWKERKNLKSHGNLQ